MFGAEKVFWKVNCVVLCVCVFQGVVLGCGGPGGFMHGALAAIEG